MKTALITGVAGTLGQALAARMSQDCHIIGYDTSEWAIAELQQDKPNYDLRLADFVDWSYPKQPVDYVIHLAAYKHVNLGETNPVQFVENNVLKTIHLFEEAARYDCQLLFVSTDKAVEPISTYGLTKALGERLAWYFNGQVGRLGNILASSGSVIPLWEKAISEGQPIPITDERMKRYFINVEEAADELYKGFLAGKRLIIPTMEEKRLLDLLEEVLARHGYNSASAYPAGVTVIGLRPGEKIEEVLYWPWEQKDV